LGFQLSALDFQLGTFKLWEGSWWAPVEGSQSLAAVGLCFRPHVPYCVWLGGPEGEKEAAAIFYVHFKWSPQVVCGLAGRWFDWAPLGSPNNDGLLVLGRSLRPTQRRFLELLFGPFWSWAARISAS